MSHQQYSDISKADLMCYLTPTTQDMCTHSLKVWLMHSCSDEISKAVVTFCMTEKSKKKKVVHKILNYYYPP